MKSARSFVALWLALPAAVMADSVSLTPSVYAEGAFSTEVVQGRTVWAATNMLYFNAPSLTWTTSGVPVYVQIEYLDSGPGKLSPQYDSAFGDTTADKYRAPEIHTRSSRVNSGVFVYSYQMFENPKFANRQNGGTQFHSV